MGRPLLRTPELAEHFVSVTMCMLEADGSGALTTRGLARAADSSLASLNGLFGGKTGLLNAVALRGFSALLDALEGAVLGAEPRANIIQLCEAYRRFAADRPHLMTHMYSSPFDSFEPTEGDLRVATGVRYKFTNEIAALLQQKPSTRVVFDTAVGLVALLDGLASQQRAGTLGSTLTTAQRRWDTAVNIYLDGAIV